MQPHWGKGIAGLHVPGNLASMARLTARARPRACRCPSCKPSASILIGFEQTRQKSPTACPQLTNRLFTSYPQGDSVLQTQARSISFIASAGVLGKKVAPDHISPTLLTWGIGCPRARRGRHVAAWSVRLAESCRSEPYSWLEYMLRKKLSGSVMVRCRSGQAGTAD